MKRWIIVVFVLLSLIFINACGDKAEKPAEDAKKVEESKPVDPKVEKLAVFAKELKATAQEGVDVPMEKLDELAKTLLLVLPETTGDLAGYEWEVSCNKNTDEKDMLFSANLNRKKGEETETAMWFHIIYNPHMSQEDRDNYGTEDFQGFKATSSENAHLWVLVNNMEIRAIADSEDFKNDAKIKSVLEKFDVKEMQKL